MTRGGETFTSRRVEPEVWMCWSGNMQKYWPQMISMKKLSPSKLFRGFVGMKSYDPVMHGDYFIIFSKFPIKHPGFNGMSRPFFLWPWDVFFFLVSEAMSREERSWCLNDFFERLIKHEDESNMVYRILAVCWFVCVCSVGHQHVIFHYLKSWQGRFYHYPVQILRNYSCLLIWCVLLFCLTWQVYLHDPSTTPPPWRGEIPRDCPGLSTP